MKKATALLLMVFILIQALCVTAMAVQESGFAPGVNFTARAVYLYNMDTGTVIYERDAHVPMPPASITKLMTTILAMENTVFLDHEIVQFPMHIQDFLYVYRRQHGAISTVGISAGDELTMRDCLYAMMIASGNEVAMNVAAHISGSQPAFADMMNRRAREIGMLNTNFQNANGLHEDGHVSTAYDVAQMALHAIQIPGFMEIAGSVAHTAITVNTEKELAWTNTNEMMNPASSFFYSPVSGIKTGFVPEAGFCLVSIATRDGFTYLLVVLGSGEYNVDGEINFARRMHFEDSRRLYNWVFDSFSIRSLLESGEIIHGVPIHLSLLQDQVKLMSDERFTSLLPNNIERSDVTFIMYTPEEFTAPVRRGEPAGEVALILLGEEIGRVPLVVAENVEATPVLLVLERLKEITSSFWFKFTIVFIILLIVLYIFLMFMRNRRRRRRGYRPRRRL
jgi:D-alanyl-D-alanine carboxypeptidase